MSRKPWVLMVNASSDIKTVGDLIAKQKAEPENSIRRRHDHDTAHGFLLNQAAGTTGATGAIQRQRRRYARLLTGSVQYVLDGRRPRSR